MDRADDEFEAFLLEVLSDFQVSIPEVGTIRAESPPLVILTSNRTRELHDALKRRCLYHWIGYPSPERELEIVAVRAPGVSQALAKKVVAAVHRLRELDLAKPPGVAETIDWTRTLDFLGETDLDEDNAAVTLGAVVKERDDLDFVRGNLRRSPPVPDQAAGPGSDQAAGPGPEQAAPPEPDEPPFVGVLSGFVAALRAAGLAAGTGDLLTYCAAMAPLDPADLLDLYWAGRATLVRRKDDIEVYDQVFRAYFLADAGRRTPCSRSTRRWRRRRTGPSSTCRPPIRPGTGTRRRPRSA